ncbi:MAG: substrate-binding domain-containing protein [Desulfobacteraceae bacterium]|nr:MAG: substrate-binding domain-containing protein [Desulfobacteraceae bacterium]
MDIKELNVELNSLREKLMLGQISRRQFLARLSKLSLAAPVALWVMQVSHFFRLPSAEAAEEVLALKMLPPIEMRDNSKFKTKPPWKVGFANPGVNNTWRVSFQACVEYQRELTPEIGEWIQTDAGEKAEKQINDIEDLMGKNLDIIMINPVTEALIPVVEQIWDRGIPSVTLDRWIQTDKVTCRTQSGSQKIVGRAFADFIGKTLGPKGGNLAWVGTITGSPQNRERQEGFDEAIKKYPKINVVGRVITGSFQAGPNKKALADIVAKNPKIDAVFCDIGWNAPSFLDVFLERNLPIPIITGDDVNGWIRLCRKHNIRTILGSWPVYCGRTGVKAVELILKGEPTPKLWWIPLLIIEEKDFDKWYRPNLPDSLWLSCEVPEEWLVKKYKIREKLA